MAEEIEDIDALLEDFKRQQLEQFKVTEESNCKAPSRRVNATLVANPVKPEELVLFGGEWYNGQKVFMFNDHFIYNTDKDEWKRITCPNSPGPRSSHQAVAMPNGLMFLFGGEFVSPNETNFFHYKDFWVLDLKKNSWEFLSVRGRPTPRSGHRMVAWKHFLVLWGGFYDQANDTKYLDDLWLFDTQDYTWAKLELPDPKPSPRSGFQFMVHHDEILMYGGYSKVATKGKKASGMMHTDVWVLKMHADPALIRWEKKKKPGGITPGQRSGCTTVYHKGKGFLFGGVSDIIEEEEAIESIVHQDFFQYVFDANKFYPIQVRGKKDGPAGSASPGPRFSPMLAVSRNHLYMLGGILEIGQRELSRSDMWSINLDKLDGWTCLQTDETVEKAWLGEESASESGSDSDDSQSDDGGEEKDSPEVSLAEADARLKESVAILRQDGADIVPLEDPNNEPRPREKMAEYFERTSPYWIQQAMDGECYSGKVLRRVAFLLSEKHYLARRPENAFIEEQMAKNEVVEEEASKKADEGGRQRNR
ncbi:hypothetical protein HDU91_005009 [Kappamyces sp. JEL0680]|nr:hypothetical protein HDU91_005009 [Kappamyces sp. JEL0680]